MTGGLMQLVAYGAQDIYLTGNPMITYFKVVYRRHTNFAMESIRQTFSGSVTYNSRVTALISRNGDLINGMTLEVDLPVLADANTRWTDDVGHHLLKQVDLEIGGQLIDRHYSDWFEIWAQLTVPAAKVAGYREMIGQSTKDHLGRPNGLQALGRAPTATRIYVPLQFWFCRNVGLALPLIALQYHEVKVNIQFESAANLVLAAGVAGGGAAPTTLSASLWVDYIYLDTDERRRFAQVSHEYLIEQLQMNEKGFDSTSVNLDLTFNHPVKELIWVARFAGADTARQWSNYSNTLALPASNIDHTAMPTVAAPVITTVQTSVVLFATDANATLQVAAPVNGLSSLTLAEAEAAPLAAGVDVAVGDFLSINGIAYLVQTGGAIGDIRVFSAAVGAGATNAIYTGARRLRYVSTNAVPALTANNLNTLLASNSSAQNFTRPTINSAGAGGNTLVDIYASNPVTDAILKLNGQDRFALRNGSYFNQVQPYTHHTNVPASPGINVYSFAIKPEEHQPSGTCNFSRIDNAKLTLTLNAGFLSTGAARTGAAIAGNVKVFAVNYNVLRVMSGMGGLAYSN